MYTKTPLAGVERGEWLKMRKNGIGGSDAGAVCGVNPFSTAMSVFKDKTNTEIEDKDNEAMRQGRDLEEYVARRFMEATGLKVRKSNFMYRSKEYPWMYADVDRLIVGEDAGLECKTASAYNADKWKDGAVPAHYLIQCCHYMAVTGKQRWYIAVVIMGQEFKYAKIDRDEEMIRNLIKIEEDFWKNHVMAGVMPDPDGSKICDEVLAQYYRTGRKGSQIELVGFEDRLARREEINALMGKMETERNQIDQEIKAFMQDNEIGYCDKYKVSWTTVNSAKIDTRRMKAEKPEVYQEFLSASTSRRFSVKAA